jgi:hypothetical protein
VERISAAVFSVKGAFSAPGAMYPPVFRMEGSTSAVTHRLNFFAPGSLLERIREYRPDSLMMVILGFPLIPS